LTEDDVYDRLGMVPQLPEQMKALESRLFGSMGPVQERLQKMEKSLGTQVGFNADAVKKVLEEYDPKLAETLVPALEQALRVNPLDEGTLEPYLSPMQQKMQEQMGEQLVLSHYGAEEIADIIPDVKDGRFVAETPRQKAFTEWYAQQGYETQQALLSFGAPYVRALKRFEKWESSRQQEQEKAAGARSTRLKSGQQPSSGGRRTQTPKLETEHDGFMSVFGDS
jgi:hypothetical protein